MRCVNAEPRSAPCTALSSRCRSFGIVGQALAHQFEARQHRHQQVVEVVGDAAGQLPDRLHLLRLQQRVTRRFELLLRFLALGDVAGDLGEADQLAVVVVDRVDDDMGPEPAAVLADALALFFKPAVLRGGAQCFLRGAGFAIFLRVELGKVGADDLLGLIALDALRPEIPADDVAFGIEHVDGVIGNALHQQPELLLASPERLFGGSALGEVARNLGKAEQRSRGIADRVDDDIGPEPGAVLADAPALAFELALAGGGGQRAGRQPPAPILLGVETREVLAEDFLARVALEALGARVPACHDAGGVQHVDGVVRHRFDQEAVAPLVR